MIDPNEEVTCPNCGDPTPVGLDARETDRTLTTHPLANDGEPARDVFQVFITCQTCGCGAHILARLAVAKPEWRVKAWAPDEIPGGPDGASARYPLPPWRRRLFNREGD